MVGKTPCKRSYTGHGPAAQTKYISYFFILMRVEIDPKLRLTHQACAVDKQHSIKKGNPNPLYLVISNSAAVSEPRIKQCMLFLPGFKTYKKVQVIQWSSMDSLALLQHSVHAATACGRQLRSCVSPMFSKQVLSPACSVSHRSWHGDGSCEFCNSPINWPLAIRVDMRLFSAGAETLASGATIVHWPRDVVGYEYANTRSPLLWLTFVWWFEICGAHLLRAIQ